MTDFSQVSDTDLLASLGTPSPAAPAKLSAAAVSQMVADEAARQGVDPAIATSLAHQESGFDQSKVSPRGAIGVMQIMPGTAGDLGIDPTDLAQNLRGGVTYYKQQYDRFGSHPVALAAYNAGPHAVQKAGGIPNFPETQDYVQSVMGRAGAQGPAAAPQQAPQGDASAAISQMSDADLLASLGQAPASSPPPGLPQNPAAPTQAAPGLPQKPLAAQPAVLPSERYQGPGQLPTSADMQTFLAGKTPQPHTNATQQYVAGVAEGVEPLSKTLVSSMTGIPSWAQDLTRRVLTRQGLGYTPAPTPAPQTTGQDWARTAGQNTVGAMAPGSPLVRAAMVAGPTVGAEAGSGVSYLNSGHNSPTARLIGSVVGGLGFGSLAGAADRVVQNITNPRTTPQQLTDQARGVYDSLRVHDVRFRPTAINSLRNAMEDVLGHQAPSYPGHSTWINNVYNTLRANPTAESLNDVRSNMQKALTKPTDKSDPNGLRLGGELVSTIDHFMGAAADHPFWMTTGTGDARQVSGLLGQARDLWRRMRNVETVENIAESAGLSKGSTETVTSDKLRPFLDPTKNKSLSGLSDAQIQQLNDVVRGSLSTRGLRTIGKFSPGKPLGIGLSLATHGASLPMQAVLGPTANITADALQRAHLQDFLRSLSTPGGGLPQRLIPPSVQGAGAGLMLPIIAGQSQKQQKQQKQMAR